MGVKITTRNIQNNGDCPHYPVGGVMAEQMGARVMVGGIVTVQPEIIAVGALMVIDAYLLQKKVRYGGAPQLIPNPNKNPLGTDDAMRDIQEAQYNKGKNGGDKNGPGWKTWVAITLGLVDEAWHYFDKASNN